MIKFEDAKNVRISIQSLIESDGEIVASILNQCLNDPQTRAALVRELIAGGYCSPPVWAFRYHYNSDIAHDSKGTLLFDSLENAEKFGETKSDGASGDAIHWKGERYEE
jgi:hypothetical protein